MKKTNKILSVLLAVVMLFSAMSLSLCASAFTAAPEGLWADPAKGLTQATVTNGTNTANTLNAKAVLDFLDSVLKDVDLSSAEDVLNVVNAIPGLKIDVNSVNGLLGTIDSVANINSTWLTRGLIKSVLGYGLVTSNWKNGQTRAKTGDVAILNNLIGFLADNQEFLGAFVANKTKQVNIETVLKTDVKTYVKQLVAKAIYNYEKDPSLQGKYDAAIKKTLDNIILEDGLGYGLNSLLKQGDDALKAMNNDVVNDLYSWGFKLEGLLDSFNYNDKLTLDATIAQIADIVYQANKQYIVKLLYTHGAELQTLIVDTEYGAPFASTLKFDKFTEESDYSFLDFTTTGSVTGINKFIGQLVMGVSTYTGWSDSKNLGGNFTNFVKWALTSIDKKGTPYEGYDFSGSNEQVALALAKMIVDVAVKDDAVKATLKKCKTSKEVVTKLVPELCKTNENIVIGKNSTTWQKVLGDIIGSFVADYAVLYTDTKNTTRYTKGSSKDIWEVLNYVANYYFVDLNFDTLFGCEMTKSESFLSKVDKLQAKVMKGLEYSKASTLIPSLLDALFALDLEKAVDEGVEKAFTNLNTKVTAANLAYIIINNALSAVVGKTVFSGTFTTIDNILSASSLEKAVQNLLSGLNSRKADLLPVILYVFGALDTETVFEVIAGTDGAVTVKYAGVALTKDTDYKVSTAVNKTGTSSKVTVKGAGNFGGVATVVSNCKNHSYGSYTVTKKATCTAAGSQYKTCKLCGKKVTESIKAAGHKAGTATTAVTKAATQKADGKTTTTTKCTVCKATIKTTTATVYKIKTVKLDKTSATYTGKEIKPAVTVKDSKSKALKSGTDYTVKYSNNKSVGKATATVTFKGKYSGTVKLTFSILPTQVKGLKASAFKTTELKLTWTKVTGAKYYKVEQSTDGKKWTVVNAAASTNSVTVKKLKAGTKYQFRVTALDSTKKLAGKASDTLKTGTLTAAPSVTLKSTKSKTATASWKAVTGATKYVVSKSTDNKKWTKVTETTKTSVNISKLTGGKKIYVKVVAVNAYKQNSAATVKSVTVKK